MYLFFLFMCILFHKIRAGKWVGTIHAPPSNYNRYNIYKNTHHFSTTDLTDQTIIMKNKNKENRIFYEKDKQLYFESNDFIMDKNLISISPGGVKGFYLLGVLSFIKETYKLDDYIFSGASAGAWNALFMCYKKDPRDFIFNILNSDVVKTQNIYKTEYAMKYKLLEICTDEDFDLRRLFIGVTTIKDFHSTTNIFSDFDNLEDAINCCIASSHIPFITGGLTNRYHDMYAFDGGFSKYPYLNVKTPILHVSPNMFQEINQTQKWIERASVFYRIIRENQKNFQFMKLYDDGYNDAKMNKYYLDNTII